MLRVLAHFIYCIVYEQKYVNELYSMINNIFAVHIDIHSCVYIYVWIFVC